MMATLCLYESWFGPYHSQTLNMMTTVAVAYGEQGELAEACRLLEMVLRDIQRLANPNHGLRLRALSALRDFWLQRDDPLKAAAAQKEVLACQAEALGAEHPETLAARQYFATLSMDAAAPKGRGSPHKPH
ncbi:MAG TPA: tetratricopeptide repeat protein [Bryobacteraceae bacterium]|jgi:hypothetical protein